MKKITALLFAILILAFSGGVCLAGDVPEALLYTDSAQLYFGKVTELTDASITILPIKKVKGEVELDAVVTYTQQIHGNKPQVGKTYLFGYIDENNLYFWVTDSMEPKSLKLRDAYSMNLRLQEYLNNGDFEKAEETRQSKAAVSAAPSVSPIITIPPSPANTQLPPANTDSSISTIAGISEKPVSSLLPIMLASLAGAVLVIVVLMLLVARRKRSGKSG